MKSKLPEGWEEIELQDIASYVNEKIDIKLATPDTYVSTTNMLPNKGGIELAEKLPKAKRIDAFEKGDVLVSNIRPYFKKIWLATFNGTSSGDVLIIRTKENIYKEFLYYVLSNDYFFEYTMKSAKGTKMPRGDKKAIMEYLVPKLSLEEQKAIADTLSALDDKIEVNNKINENLEAQAQVIFKHWFVDFEFPDENGMPYKSSGGEMVDSELGMIPKGWKTGELKDLGDIVGGSTPSRKKEEYFTENGIPWLTPRDLSNNDNLFIDKGETDITEEGFNSTSVHMLPVGTVLFSSRAPIGYTAIAKNEITTNQGFKSVVPNKNKGVSTIYIYCWLKENIRNIENRASGSTFKEISGGELKKVSAIIPDKKILVQFEKSQENILKLLENNEEENKVLTELRDTLLPKLMSGELRIPLDDLNK